MPERYYQVGEGAGEVSMRDTLAGDLMQGGAASTDHSLSKTSRDSVPRHLDTSAFNALERDVQDMLCEIAEDKG